MISLKIVLLILFLHFLGDFALQTRNMSERKYKSIKWLSIHAGTYAVPFLVLGPSFAVVNGVGHFMIDFVSSKITRYFFRYKNWFWFWLTIGIDQALHFILLFASYVFLKQRGLFYV